MERGSLALLVRVVRRGLAGALVLGVPYAALGQTAPATAFYTVRPCRLVDTRGPLGDYGGPALLAYDPRAFLVAGRCGIPLSAQAISVSLAVVSPTGAGHLTLYPCGVVRPNTSSINFRAGQTRANNAILPVGGYGCFVTYLTSQPYWGAADFVLDVTGYFGTAGCPGAQTPLPPRLTVDTGARTLTWPPVLWATSYNLYVKAVAGECGLLPPQIVTRSDQVIPGVSSPFDLSGFNQCGTCYFVDAVSLSGQCESPLQSDAGAPAPIGFALLPCAP